MFTTRRVARSRHEPVLGTVLDIRLTDRRTRKLREAERALLVEIDRLEQVFSVFRPDSDLSRWRADPSVNAQPSAEVVELLSAAEFWQQRSNGVFNPASGQAQLIWKAAEASGRIPTDVELDLVAQEIAEPRFRVEGPPGTPATHPNRRSNEIVSTSTVTRIGDCRSLTFHAIAKGFIVDLALAHLMKQTPVASALVNIGGDLVHHGDDEVIVGIEGTTSTDNAAPVQRVALSNAALATSGGTRRGFQVGDTWFSHVIDPRTARPVSAIAGATVIAPTAATADVLATIVGILTPPEAIAFVDALTDPFRPVACRISVADGSVVTSPGWADYVRD